MERFYNNINNTNNGLRSKKEPICIKVYKTGIKTGIKTKRSSKMPMAYVSLTVYLFSSCI